MQIGRRGWREARGPGGGRRGAQDAGFAIKSDGGCKAHLSFFCIPLLWSVVLSQFAFSSFLSFFWCIICRFPSTFDAIVGLGKMRWLCSEDHHWCTTCCKFWSAIRISCSYMWPNVSIQCQEFQSFHSPLAAPLDACFSLLCFERWKMFSC